MPGDRVASSDDERGLSADLRRLLEQLEFDPGATIGPTPIGIARVPLALDSVCAHLIEILRTRCPGFVPTSVFAPGESTPPLRVSAGEFVALFTVALRSVGREGNRAKPSADALLWQELGDELLVEVGSVKTELGEGLVDVHVPVRCDQLPNKTDVVLVRVAVGTDKRPTGLFTALPSRPFGPAVVVDRWGDALNALAWRAFVEVLRGIARNAGRDRDDVPLLPTAVTASRDGIALIAQARHAMDRRVR